MNGMVCSSLNLGNKTKWESHLDIITMPTVGAKGGLHPIQIAVRNSACILGVFRPHWPS